MRVRVYMHAHAYERIPEILHERVMHQVINRVMDAAKAKVTATEPCKVQGCVSFSALLSTALLPATFPVFSLCSLNSFSGSAANDI